MAHVRLRSGKWYVRYINASGVEREVVTTAQGKTEAKRLALELGRKVERQRLGLEVLPNESGLTFWGLCDWWLKKRCRPRSRKDEEYRLSRHVKGTALGDAPLGQVTKSTIADRLRGMEEEGKAAGTLNKVRSILHTVIHRAMQEDPPLWAGPNPVDLVDSRQVTKRVYHVLTANEIELVLKWAPRAWRGEIAAGVYMALRKGEILGMRSSDIDLEHRLLAVRRSFDHATTKTDAEATVPIPPMMVPYLKAALERGGPLVFPGKGGKMRSKEADPHKVLRRTLGRAGLVTGYSYVCRRCKSKGQEPHTWPGQKLEARRCERCKGRLWPVAIPRPMRFHDLRHSTATILLTAGVPMQHVQRILRHAQISTTVNLYGHMIAEGVRAGVNEGWERALEPAQETSPGRARNGQGTSGTPETERPDALNSVGISGL